MPITLAGIKAISEGATDIVSVDLTQDLDASELAVSATVAEVGTSDLTVANLGGSPGVATVTTGVVEIDGRNVAAAKAIRWKISGQQAGTTYRIRYVVTTDSTPARVLPRDLLIACE
jgi:hypothetical protein